MKKLESTLKNMMLSLTCITIVAGDDILSLFLKFPLILSQMPDLSLTISGLKHLRKQVPDIVIHNFTHLFTVEEKSCETIFFRAVSVIFFNSCMNYDSLCRKVLFHSACSGENALRNFR